MSVVISSSYVLSLPPNGGDTPTLDNPLIGYQNVITSTNIIATASDVNFPVSNLGNPATNLKWKGTGTGTQYLTITTGTINPIDYVGIAKHNFWTAQAQISIEIAPTNALVYTQVVAPVILPNDGPALFQFTPQTCFAVRIKIVGSLIIPVVGAVYNGKLLILQRRIYVGHTPITYGRDNNIVNGVSEAGEFLGRILIGSNNMTAVSMKNITPSWYRSYFDPFIIASITKPFFFAWRPYTYPNEVGYAWITNNVKPTNQLVNGFMSVDFQISGVT